MSFIRKKVKSKTLGERLAEIREELEVELGEIAKATKIRRTYLEMIEKSQFEKLPPHVYVKGFLKSYAKYLGIETEDVLRLYERERGIQNSIEKLKASDDSSRIFRAPSLTVTPGFIMAGVSLLIVCVGFYYFYSEVGKFSKDPRLVITGPIENVLIQEEEIEVSGVTDKDSKAFINDQPVFVDGEGKFSQRVSLQPGINELRVKVISRFDREIERALRVEAQYEKPELAEGESGEERVLGAQDELREYEEVILEIEIAERPTWFEITADEEKVFSGVMQPDEEEKIFRAENQIQVISAKADQTLVKFNDQEAAVLSDNPGVDGAVFTRKGREEIEEESEEEGDQDETSESGEGEQE